MNTNDIFTEIEYTKERSAEELFEWFTLKNEELRGWSEALGKKKHKELSKGLPDKFAHELTPFAYFAKNYFGDKYSARFTPCFDSDSRDGIVVDNGKRFFVEITEAIFGDEWAIQKELLGEMECAPWWYSILGVNKKNRAEKKQEAIDIVTGVETEDKPGKGAGGKTDRILHTKIKVIKRANEKCEKSKLPELLYGRNKTILIIAFDDSGFNEKDWGDFVNFKQAEIDSMEHNFIKIILFGWISKKFIPENL